MAKFNIRLSIDPHKKSLMAPALTSSNEGDEPTTEDSNLALAALATLRPEIAPYENRSVSEDEVDRLVGRLQEVMASREWPHRGQVELTVSQAI